MIMGVCKTLGVTPDYALNEISYANIFLYSSTISYDKVDNNKKDKRKISGETQEAQDLITKLARESE